jgi:nuclear pore complex protein Nup98-Nup96
VEVRRSHARRKRVILVTFLGRISWILRADHNQLFSTLHTQPAGRFCGLTRFPHMFPTESSISFAIISGHLLTILSASGAFGANNNTATTTFGSTPFGAAKTGSNLFGGNAGSTGSFGSGFGGTTANTTSAFGGGNASGGGMFGGAAKPAFGAGTTATTGSTLFGGGNTGGGFGASNTGSGFGASNTAGFQGQQANQGPQPNNGTATTPFNAFTEKDGTSATAQQQYQTITFQDPYKSYSLEELRAVDYNQGRRFGNQNGQAGAFGQSTGFGGFGAGNTTTPSTGFGNTASTGGGLFGNNNAGTTSAFGAGNTTTAFGSSANTSGGGLFGQNKPATGGLFGGAATSQPAATGGLFGGGATANTGAFGSTGGTGFGNTNTAAGGLFGNTNTQAAAKPFNGFGASTAAPAATNPFGGAATNTGGGLFGGGGQTQAASTPFGGGQTQQPAATGGLFGGGGGNAFGGAQQPQAQAQTGGLFGGFGNTQQNQQKPAGGLFGAPAATTTGGGLFGGVAQQPQQTSSLFNNAGTQNNAGGGLFGAKPATTGGLFGSTGNTGGSTGGLFGGAAQNTQQNTGGLFGQSNQQKPAGGLFGGSTASTNTGGGLFGGLGQNNAGGSTMGNSLFSSQNQQQQQQQPMGNSLFGASGNSLLQTSMNTNPYGNDTLFAGLNTPTQSPGPLATPLSSSTKTKKSAILPQSKLNPSASTRLLTPQNRGRPGYGFTYSTYGTPNSASSNGSPVLGGSLFGSGSISRSLGKSMSTSNLRNSFTPETSILAPGAFSTNGRSFASGSLKKLNINRSINNRVPLFDEPSHDKKRVSFAGTGAEERATNGATTNGSASNALVLREEDSPSEGPASFNGGAVNGSNGAPSRSEMEQVNGNAAAAAPQRALGPRTASSLNLRGQNGKVSDPSPGAYWSSPSLQELRQMSQAERRNVRLIVGRDQIGQIEFNMGQPVDLTTVDIEKLYGDIVQLNHRNATVYGQSTTVPKPALGTGLNHPSRITLGNSWPRNRAGKKDQKHLERLKRVGGTTFENYNPATGDWIFTVPHFSTYGLNDSDYSDDEEEEESSELSPVPDTPAQVDTTQMTGTPQDDSFVSPVQSSPDDTFDFKKGNRLRASVPGGFGDEAAYEEDAEMETSMTTGKQSFLGERSVGSLDGQHDDFDYSEEYESGSVEDQDMADSVSGPIQTTEQPLAKEKDSDPFRDSIMPKSILKAGQTLRPAFGTPSKGHLVFDDDWANQLQRTISPRKQDRHALRESQGDALRERDMNASVANFGATLGQSFGATTIPSRMDLMNDLFGETDKGGMAKRAGHGIEV